MAMQPNNNLSHAALQDFPTASVQDVAYFFESSKITSLQQSDDLSVIDNSDSQLVCTDNSTLTSHQAAVDSVILPPGLSRELRSLQLEGGFQSTDDFLHHLVVSERVRRLQVQQRLSDHNYNCQHSTAKSTIPVEILTKTQGIDVQHSAGQNSQATGRVEDETGCWFNGSHGSLLPAANNRTGPSGSAVGKTENASIGVQVSLCCSRLKGVASMAKRLSKNADNAGSKVKKKKHKRRLQQGDAGRRDGGRKLKQMRRRRKAANREPPCQTRLRMPGDRKAAAARDEQAYLCEICGVTFKWRRSLIPHMWEHRDKATFHKCLHCHALFPYACRLKRHLIAKHPELEGGPIRCATCGVEVQSYHTLKSHMRIHTGYRPFKCKFCPKTYKWNTGLEYHERVHTGERPFPCRLCKKAFTNKSDLTRHQTVHTGEKPHVCKNCGKGFTQSHTLKSHCKKHHDGSTSPVQKPPLSQFVQTAQPFMLGGYRRVASTAASNANNARLQQMSYANSSCLHEQATLMPTEREIAEVVVNMLAQT